MPYRYTYGQERELSPTIGVTIAVGLLFVVGWIFIRTLRPI